MTQDASARSRVQLWHDVVSISRIIDSPGVAWAAWRWSIPLMFCFSMWSICSTRINCICRSLSNRACQGLVAFLWMVAAAVWALFGVFKSDRRRKSSGHRCAASLVALSVHGLFDSELYASGLVLLVFVPIGFAWALQNASRNEDLAVSDQSWTGGGRWLFSLAPIASVLMLFVPARCACGILQPIWAP